MGVGIHQVSVFNPLLFILILGLLCMSFALVYHVVVVLHMPGSAGLLTPGGGDNAG